MKFSTYEVVVYFHKKENNTLTFLFRLKALYIFTS